MSGLASYFQLLVVESEERVSKRTKEKYQYFKAHAVALDHEFKPMFVGHLDIGRDAREGLVSGEIYAADYQSRLSEYGDKKGEIVSEIARLTVVPASARPKGVQPPVSKSVPAAIPAAA